MLEKKFSLETFVDRWTAAEGSQHCQNEDKGKIIGKLCRRSSA